MIFNLNTLGYIGVRKYPSYAETVIFNGLITNLVSSPVAMHNCFNFRDIVHNDICK